MAASDVQIQIIGKDLASAAFRQVDAAAKSTESRLASVGMSAGRMGGMLRNAASVSLGVAGFEGTALLLNKSIGSVIDFSKGLEAAGNGMAGILMSMAQVDGRTLSWGESLSIASGIISRMNDEALRTSATSQELVRGVQALLAPGLASGMTVKQIEQLTVTGVNAVKSLNLPSFQVVQELRDLVAGGIQPASSTLATSLGLKDSDIAAAKASSEGLFKFLMDRLQGFTVASGEYAKTFAGLNEQFKEGLVRGGSQGSEMLFSYAKQNLKEIVDQIVKVDETSKTVTLNQGFISGIASASEKAIMFAEGMKNVGSTVGSVASPAINVLGSAIGYAAQNAENLTYAIGSWMILSKVTAVYIDVAAAARGATEAQTAWGRSIAQTNLEQARLRTLAVQAAEAQKIAITQQIAQIKIMLAAERQRTEGLMKVSAGYAEQYAAIDKARLALIGAAQAAKNGQVELAEQILRTNELLASQAKIAATSGKAVAAGATGAAMGMAGGAGAGKIAAETAEKSAGTGAMLAKVAGGLISTVFGMGKVYLAIMALELMIENAQKVIDSQKKNYKELEPDEIIALANTMDITSVRRNQSTSKTVTPGSGDPYHATQGPPDVRANKNVVEEITAKYNRQKEELAKIDRDVQISILKNQDQLYAAQLLTIQKEKDEWMKKGISKVRAEQWAASAIVKANEEAANRIRSAYDRVESARNGVAGAFSGSFGSAINDIVEAKRAGRSYDTLGAVQKIRDEYELRKSATREVALYAGFSQREADLFTPMSPWETVDKAMVQYNQSIVEFQKVYQTIGAEQSKYLSEISKYSYETAKSIELLSNSVKNTPIRNRQEETNVTTDANGNRTNGIPKGQPGSIILQLTVSPTVVVNGMDAESREQLGQIAAREVIPAVVQAVSSAQTSFAGGGG